MTVVRRGLVEALRRSPLLAREIALVLIVKTVLLALLFNGLSAGPAPRRVDAGLTEQHLLGRQVNTTEDADGR